MSDDLLDEFERMLSDWDDDKKVTNPKNGDYVIYNGQHKARVIRALLDGKVRIVFDRKDLHPNKMNVPAESLEWVYENGTRKKYINPQIACPACDVAWKKSYGFRDIYFDCPKCGMKKEDALG